VQCRLENCSGTTIELGTSSNLNVQAREESSFLDAIDPMQWAGVTPIAATHDVDFENLFGILIDFDDLLNTGMG
jgi:hypothetical protein